MSKRLLAVLTVIITLCAITVALCTATLLRADAAEQCVPADAWTEVIEHPQSTHNETVTVTDTEAWTETVVDAEAHWQRYSWTGGPHESDSAPAFPSEDWQANTQSDPHGIGVEGAYFRSHGNSGNGDWFYLELVGAVTRTVEHPAVTHEDSRTVVDMEAWTEYVEYPAVVCEPPVVEEPPTIDTPPVITEDPPVKNQPPVSGNKVPSGLPNTGA